MKIDKRVSSAAFKCRGLFWGIFAAGILIFPASFSFARFAAGILFLIAGQLLRLWAAGYIPKYRTEVIGAPILITWGPYKWIRNPLYAGNALMGLGWALMAGWGWVAAFAAAFLLLYSLIIIPAEEEFPLHFPDRQGGTLPENHEYSQFQVLQDGSCFHHKHVHPEHF